MIIYFQNDVQVFCLFYGLLNIPITTEQPILKHGFIQNLVTVYTNFFLQTVSIYFSMFPESCLNNGCTIAVMNTFCLIP